jgi:iron complex outermembrane recepter protein
MSKLSTRFILTAAALAVSSAYAADKDVKSDVEQVIVTAQKRAQSILDVPQSMSVVSGAALELQQANTFSDYLKLVPGLQLVQSTPGAGRLVLRGIDTGGVASTVVVYVDETPFGSSSGLVNGAVLAGDFDTFDMNRVEVLRGPQGALYGASSLGGLLKFVTNAPEIGKTIFRARAGAASTQGGDMSSTGNIMMNAPMGDTAAIRASASSRKQGGFVDSIGTGGSDLQDNINSSRSFGGRGSFMWVPNKDFSMRLSAIVQNIQANASSSVESDPNTLDTLYGRFTQSQFIPQYRNVNYRVYNGTLNWDMGFASLTSSTSSSTQNQNSRTDVTFNLSALVAGAFKSPNELYLGQDTNLKKITQELRLTSNPGSSFDWLTGVYYTNEKGLIMQQYVPVTPGTLNMITTLPNLALVNLNSSYREVAGFGNVTAHVTQSTDLDLGARYSRNSQQANQISSGALVGAPTNNIANSEENVFTYSVAPKLKLDAGSSLYGRLAKGFRPGGPNVLPPSAPAGTPKTYLSDTVLSAELGYKTRSADGSFAFDVAAFNINWKDIQLLAQVNGFGVNTNGVSASSKGLEFTATVRPLSGLTLSVNGTFSNAKLDGNTSPLVGGVSGDRLPFSPKVAFGMNGNYRWNISDTGLAFVGASARYVGDQTSGFDATYRTANGRQRAVASYNVFDMQAGIDFGAWTLEAYAKNLINSTGRTSTSGVKANGSNLNPNGAMLTGVLTPRTLGVSLTMEY